MPGGCHGRDIIEHMTLRLFHRSKIGHNLLRLHNYLSQQKYSRTHDFTDHSHHADNGVHLGQVSALCVQLLPDIGHGINPDDINATVCQIQKIVHHLIENSGIPVVQIPLIWIKRGHYIVSRIRQPGEISRRRDRKYLGHAFLISGRQVKVVEKEVAAHIFALSPACPFRPLVLL